MKIIVAPDSFKDCLSAKEVSASITKGIRQVYPEAIILEIPLSDGGEGLIDALLDGISGTVLTVPVLDPLGRTIRSEFGVLKDGKTAIIELARASGLELLKEKERNPLLTSTYGTGQLIKAALDHGCEKIIVGLGGSATNDGGTGMLKALGARFLDVRGEEVGDGGGQLENLERIDLSNFDTRIGDCEVVVACDVSNPLAGPNGASFIYGAQKGGDERSLELLDNSLYKYGSVIRDQFNIDVVNKEGAGAAGGTGAALLAFMNGKIVNGIDLVLQMVSMEQHLNNTDLVVTGEGKIDLQTLNGKTVVGVSKMAKKHQVPVIVLAGKVGDHMNAIFELGVTAVFPIVDGPIALEEALKKAPQLLERTARNIMNTIKEFKVKDRQ
ncbi:Glycerate 2-kinase [Arenibacter antarcticus]|uniref:Glycerate kinase n=1 Tax=Arenibacter antarcticus TaxID=2040469 RepID=A0ABW5VMN3_9FLAO|nr:glycerate kinase [Arenibacter sp. H213]MCM4167007.1 glycerate kinase [Arenibacter sp. H213]